MLTASPMSDVAFSASIVPNAGIFPTSSASSAIRFAMSPAHISDMYDLSFIYYGVLFPSALSCHLQ